MQMVQQRVQLAIANTKAVKILIKKKIRFQKCKNLLLVYLFFLLGKLC